MKKSTKKKRPREACESPHYHAPPGVGNERDYGTEEYWEQRYANLPNDSNEGVEFEWLYSYSAIQPLFRDMVKLDSNILDVGCGTSRLIADLRDDGYRGRIVAIDYSAAAIDRLCQLLGGAKATTKAKLELLEMDARAMEFRDGEFDVVLDKATVDAMMSSEDNLKMVSAYCSEVARVLTDRGHFVMMTHLDPESNEAVDALQDGILPGLNQAAPSPGAETNKKQKQRKAGVAGQSPHEPEGGDPWWWTLDVHSMADNEDMPHIYVFTKHIVRVTRSTSLEFDPADRFTMEHHLH